MQKSSALILFFGGLLMLAGFGFAVIMTVLKLLEGELTDIPLILGLSLFAITPGSIAYFLARHVLRGGPSQRAGIIGALFALPLLGLGIGLAILTTHNIFILGAIFAVSGLLCAWSLCLMHAGYKAKTPTT